MKEINSKILLKVKPKMKKKKRISKNLRVVQKNKF